jgi:hypothetical protein
LIHCTYKDPRRCYVVQLMWGDHLTTGWKGNIHCWYRADWIGLPSSFLSVVPSGSRYVQVHEHASSTQRNDVHKPETYAFLCFFPFHRPRIRIPHSPFPNENQITEPSSSDYTPAGPSASVGIPLRCRSSLRSSRGLGSGRSLWRGRRGGL